MRCYSSALLSLSHHRPPLSLAVSAAIDCLRRETGDTVHVLRIEEEEEG